jgi:membrane-associated phospholipid phosphatase
MIIRPGEKGNAMGLCKWFCGQSRFNRAVLLLSGFWALMVFVDGPVRHYAQTLDPTLRHIFGLITNLGDSFWPILITLILMPVLYLLERRQRGMDKTVVQHLRGVVTFVFASVVITGLTASLLKNSIGRGRPSNPDITSLLDFSPLAFSAPWASFPSGHSTTALALATALALIFPRHAIALMCIGAWGAISRAMLGVHWVSDIVAGAMLGTLGVLWLKTLFARKGLVFARAGRQRPVLSARICARFARIMRTEAARLTGRRR